MYEYINTFLISYLNYATCELYTLVDVVDMRKLQIFMNKYTTTNYTHFTFWNGWYAKCISDVDENYLKKLIFFNINSTLKNLNFFLKFFFITNFFLVKLIFFKVTSVTLWIMPALLLFISALILLFYIKPTGANIKIWLAAKYIIIFILIYQFLNILIFFKFYQGCLLFKVGKAGAFFLPFNLGLAKLISSFLILISILITLLFYMDYYKKIILNIKPEFCSILLFLGFGSTMAFLQNDLFSLFLYFEIISFCIYGLLFLHKRTNAQLHSLVRYVLLSLWVSTCYIFGLTFYLISCKTSTSLFAFSEMRWTSLSFYWHIDTVLNFEYMRALANPDFNFNIIEEFELLLSIIFILIYFLFKLGAGPFYNWTIEVYNASSTGSLFIISLAPKLIYFPIMFFLLFYNFIEYSILWTSLLFVVGVLTVFIGSFGILLTDKLKEIYAWSSIVHTGNLLLILSTLSSVSLTFLMFYLTSYYLISFGFIVLITSLRNKLTGRFIKTISELNSINNLHSNFYILAIILLASASGFTPFLSFFMKFSLLSILTSYYGVFITILIGLLNIIGSVAYLWMLRNIIGFNTEKYFYKSSDISKSFTEVNQSYFISSIFIFIIFLIIFSFIFYKDFTQLFSVIDNPCYVKPFYYRGVLTNCQLLGYWG